MLESSLLGKSALVTGASRGIGKGICDALERLGVQVCRWDRDTCDLTSVQDIRAALKDMQPVDFVVNNAGVALLEDFLDIDFSKWDQTMAVNLRAAAVISQECARKMIESGISGTIVNVSSQAAYRALPGHTSYCVSKAALDHLTRMMALELGPKGIRINSVNPTVVLTDMGRKAWEDPEKSSKMLSRIPLRKFAQVDDVVNVVMFLLSDLSNMVHGAVIPVDGGFSVG